MAVGSEAHGWIEAQPEYATESVGLVNLIDQLFGFARAEIVFRGNNYSYWRHSWDG
jgi:hypothetical protein